MPSPGLTPFSKRIASQAVWLDLQLLLRTSSRGGALIRCQHHTVGVIGVTKGFQAASKEAGSDMNAPYRSFGLGQTASHTGWFTSKTRDEVAGRLP